MHFNHYTDGIAAAVGGQGVALGWNFILGDLLVGGQLVRLAEHGISVEQTYNVVVPKRRTTAPAAAFAQWIGRILVDPGGQAVATLETPHDFAAISIADASGEV